LTILLIGSLFTQECCAEDDHEDIWAEYAGNPLNEDDFKRAMALSDETDDEESGEGDNPDLFEGDIVLPEGTTPEELREVIKDNGKKWPKNQDGLVYLPYTIENVAWGQDVNCNGRFEAWKCSACGSSEVSCGGTGHYAQWAQCMWVDGQCVDKPNEYARAAIARVAMEYAAKTCVRLVPYAEAYPENVAANGKILKHDDKKVYPDPAIRFRPGSGYSSPLGMEQWTVNSISCGRWKWGKIAHEVMHTLGFFHEHTRLDRDDWIKVNWDAIDREMREQWDLCKDVPALHASCRALTAEYDYGSIMHYSQFSIGWDGKEKENFTRLKPVPAGVTIGQRHKLSPLDVKGIRDFYGCADGSHDSSIRLD